MLLDLGFLTDLMKNGAFHSEQYCAHLDQVATEFNQHFGELGITEDIATFISNRFLPINIEQVAVKVFALPSGADMEMVDLKNDIELKARSRDSDSTILVSREKFPHLTACALN